jgi:hypothetical protein
MGATNRARAGFGRDRSAFARFERTQKTRAVRGQELTKLPRQSRSRRLKSRSLLPACAKLALTAAPSTLHR